MTSASARILSRKAVDPASCPRRDGVRPDNGAITSIRTGRRAGLPACGLACPRGRCSGSFPMGLISTSTWPDRCPDLGVLIYGATSSERLPRPGPVMRERSAGRRPAERAATGGVPSTADARQEVSRRRPRRLRKGGGFTADLPRPGPESLSGELALLRGVGPATHQQVKRTRCPNPKSSMPLPSGP